MSQETSTNKGHGDTAESCQAEDWLSPRIPVSPGELVDRMTILQIKRDKLSEDDPRRATVLTEYDLVKNLWISIFNAVKQDSLVEVHNLSVELLDINSQLWDVEDKLRELDPKVFSGSQFAPDHVAEYVLLARSVYQLNDRRAAAKKRVNTLLGASLTEVKLYKTND